MRICWRGGRSEPQALLTSARPYVTAGLRRHAGQALILLTTRSEVANQLATELESWLTPGDDEQESDAEGTPVLLFAEPEALPYERIAWSSVTRQRRLTALTALQSRTGTPPVVVAGARALMQMTLPARSCGWPCGPSRSAASCAWSRWRSTGRRRAISPSRLWRSRAPLPGAAASSISGRPICPRPVRIDLFGDEVDSLRIFDPATQRTVRQVRQVEIGPGGEALSKYGPTALARLGIQGDRLTDPANLAGAGKPTSPLQDPNLLLAIREELRREVEQSGRRAKLSRHRMVPALLLRSTGHAARLPARRGGCWSSMTRPNCLTTVHELDRQSSSLREELERTGNCPRLCRRLFSRG